MIVCERQGMCARSNPYCCEKLPAIKNQSWTVGSSVRANDSLEQHAQAPKMMKRRVRVSFATSLQQQFRRFSEER